MAENRVVIFEAPTIDAAYRLRSVLDQEGIAAVVLASCQPAAEAAPGRPVAARVAVDPQYAEQARHIVRVWQRTAAGEAGQQAPEGSGQQAAGSAGARTAGHIPPNWPRCPQCHVPRLTWCPICQTAGTRFEAADDVPSDLFDELAGGACAVECSGSVCARSTHSPPAAQIQPPEAPAGTEAGLQRGGEAPGMVLCPTCDEPFVPAFARHCEWCGYEFADGVDFTPLLPEEAESLGPRALGVFVALLALAGLLAGYVLYLW